MNLFEFVTAGPNLPFGIALLLMVLIALLEGVGALFGLGLGNLLEGMVPDFDPGVAAELPDGEAPALSKVLGWLRFGDVPALVLLIVFLTAFGLIGLTGQGLLSRSVGLVLPGPLAALGAFAASLPVVRLCGGLLARVLPKDETSAVSPETFVGRIAVITLGTARAGSPAEARLEDQFGQSHYVMVEPDAAEQELAQGEQVLLVRTSGSRFIAIRNTHPAMVD